MMPEGVCRTRIMATVADDRCTPERISALIKAGMEGVRINSAHVSPDRFAEMVTVIRSVDPSVYILMDTKGAEVRLTAPRDTISLDEGDTLRLKHGTDASTSAELHVPVAEVVESLREDMRLMIDDGAIELVVTGTGADAAECRVVRGGVIDAAKTVNIPGVDFMTLPAVTERDRAHIEKAVECRISAIAHSFVRSAADIDAVRRITDGSGIELYSKVECVSALRHLDEIIAASDGILVARGDLGANIDPAAVPVVQREVMSRCRAAGKPTILSTQILQSMIHQPSATRAEITDAWLGVEQEARWLLLCGETAQGHYPAECVATLRRVIDCHDRNFTQLF